jgi:hypothetical protein
MTAYTKKQLKQKRAGDVAQMIEYLASKDKTLSLIPSSAKKNKTI